MQRQGAVRRLHDRHARPAAGRPFYHFLVVELDNQVSLDFYQKEGEVARQHYAFLVGEAEFDAAYGRIREQGMTYWADPARTKPGESTTRRTRRLAQRPSSTRAWVAIWASIGAVVTEAVRARSTVRRNCSMRGPWSATQASTTAAGSPLLRRSRNSSRNCSKSRARPAVSSRSHWSRAWKRLAAFCAQSSPRASPKLGVGAGQLDLVDADLAAQCGEADRAVQLEQAHDLGGDLARRAHLVQLGAQAPGFGARFGPEQVADHRIELGEARPQQVDQCAGSHVRRGDAEHVGDVELKPGGGLVEQSEAHLLRHVGRVELGPERVHVEQSLGGEEGGGGLAEGRAFLLGQRERRDDAEPVDEAVGDLGGDDLPAQPMGEDGVAVPLAHRPGEGVAELGRQRRIVGEFRRLDRRLQPHLGGRQQDRQLGPGQPQILLGAAEQLLVAVQPLDRAVELAALLEDLDDADELRQRPRAAPLGDRQRQRLQPIVLEHEPGDLVGHLGEQQVALLELEPPLGHLAVQRDLDVDLIVRAIDAGAIVDEVGVDPPASSG